MTWREINKEVYRVYPVTDRERGCAREKRRRDALREILRNRLEHEQNGTKAIYPADGANKQAV